MSTKDGKSAGSNGPRALTNEQSLIRLLNARDAVDYLGISLSTLNRIEKQGLLIPFRTPGGHRRYALSMLDEYLESTRHQPNRDSREGISSRRMNEDAEE